jgi:SAM-dependent methyltransferase
LAPAEEVVGRDDWDKHWLDFADAAEQSPAQSYRRRVALRLLRLDEERPRVLDLGSGTGDFAVDLLSNKPDAELLGLEVSEAGIEISQRKVPAARFELRDLTRPEDPPPNERKWATHAVCIEVLEHVDAPRDLLANAAPYMAPGCHLVVTVPGGPMSAFDRHIGHRRHFAPADLRALLTDAGFEVEMAAGTGFPFFNLYRLVAILRGRNLIEDMNAEGGANSGLARIVMGVFGILFRLNLPIRRWGWQTVAVARLPGQGPASAR